MERLALTIPGSNGTPTELQAPTGIPSGISIGKLAQLGIQTALVIGMLLSLMYLVYGGIFWIQSRGAKEKLDKARRIIVYAILGLVVMALSLVIVNIVGQALGVGALDLLTK